MGRSYLASTVERYDSLVKRGVDCQNGPGLCLRKAKIVQRIEVFRDDGSIIGIEDCRTCLKHYSPNWRNAKVLETRRF